jgi:phosphoserine phosphatase
MVDRCKLVALDLDGTLIAGNSLHEYIKCGVVELLRAAKVAAALWVVLLVALRALRVISHRRMKFAALSAIELTPRLRSRFAAKVKAMRRPEVEAMMRDYRERGCEVLLATAAADVYVPLIWQDRFIATPVSNNPKRIELRGENKRDAVLQYAAAHGMVLYAVITDDADDLALLTAGAAHNVLVHPSASTVAAANMAGIPNLTILS